MNQEPAVSVSEGEGDGLLQQRDLAVVCAILMAALSGMILWNNFGKESFELKQAEAAVRSHREMLGQHESLLASVHSALVANQQELERINQAKHGAH